MKRLSFVVITCTCIVGMAASVCAVSGESERTLSSIDPSTAITQAKKSVKKTDAVGFLWRDTNQLITDAEAAAAKGDRATAVQLALQAQHQAENGYQQYERSRSIK